MLRRGLRRLAACQPHLHRHPCSVCGEVPAAASPTRAPTVSLDASLDSAASATEGTVADRRRAALLRWLRRDVACEGQVSVPHTLSVPAVLCPDVAASSDFERRVRRALGDDDAAVQKQMRFRTALLDTRRVLCGAEVKLPFFLGCGTALGARREGYFIPHDDDIDLGVFYEDLVAMGDAASDDAVVRAREGAVRLLSAFACTGQFIVLDVCGEVERGLEVRLLHRGANVRVDLNVYYRALQPDDAARVAAGGDFVWMATFYAAAAGRRYGMYRYRHAPFRDALEMMPLCDDDGGDGFAVPPVTYLEEAFGPDWRTPRAFTYEQGLAQHEYKNIIDE